MTQSQPSPISKAGRGGLFLLFLACGISLPSLSGLFIFPFSLVPQGLDWLYRISLSTVFLVASIILMRSEYYSRYWKAFFAFFVASIALNVQAISEYFDFRSTPINNAALAMLSSTLLVVISIVAISLVSGEKPAAIYLTKGNLKWGLLVGSIGFGVFALVSIPAATYLFQGHDITVGKASSWAVPILITVLANGFREELLYRGIFLKKYESLLGSKSANLLQAIIFSLSHSVAGMGSEAYTPYTVVLVLFTLVLGLAWGFVMQRTNSIWGSVLFHAGSDISIFLGIFSNLP